MRDDLQSCIIFSTPRAGTHAVMKGLWLAGMQEAPAIREWEWMESHRTGKWKLLDMPERGYYRFGAHEAPESLRAAYRESNLRGIFVVREYEKQLRSLVAHYHVIQGQKISEQEARQVLHGRLALNLPWAYEPRVLTVRYEHLFHPHVWYGILNHLGCNGEILDDPASIVNALAPKEGDIYYENTLPSREFYKE